MWKELNLLWFMKMKEKVYKPKNSSGLQKLEKARKQILPCSISLLQENTLILDPWNLCWASDLQKCKAKILLLF